MNIAIIGSGGDAPGMNPAIKKFVEYVFERGHTPLFIYDGLEGLIDNKIKKAKYSDVSGIIQRGGAIIGSSRSKRFYDYKYRQIAYQNLQKYSIDAIVVLGGDGSFRAFDLLNKEFKINFVGIPTTIDNDIFGTEYCIGVDTALNVIREAIDKIRDTASTFSRAFVVETMGRECGYLAGVSALVSGVEVCVIPEIPFDIDKATKILKNQFENGRKYILAVVAEGTKKTNEIAKWLENEFDIETRITVLGHIQRGGSPTVRDRLIAAEFVVKSIDYILSPTKDTNVVVGYNDGRFDFIDIDTVVNNKYELDKNVIAFLS